MSGVIYFIRCCDFVKIGFSTNLEARFSALQACSPFQLELIAAHVGSVADERIFHAKAAPYRVRHEWFRWEQEVQDLARTGIAEQANIRRARSLAAAINAVGGVTNFAKNLPGKISVQAVSQWDRVPPLRVLDVERITGVPRHELRPDLYPPADAEKVAAA